MVRHKHGIGDLLTFWILDDQSKHILARCVVRPFSDNLRVKWDPKLDKSPIKFKSKVTNPDYVNLGLADVETVEPTGPIARSQGRLMLHNADIPVDDTFKSFIRGKNNHTKRYNNKMYMNLQYIRTLPQH